MNLSSEDISMLSTDASPNNDTAIGGPSAINARVLRQVERELEEFEKISILFLIAADDPLAYEKILSILNNGEKRHAIIEEYVGKNLDLWGEKLVEALSIINNQEVLKNLGFNPSDVISRYHSGINCIPAKINTVAKILYKLFETMNGEKTKSLLHCVYEEDRLHRQLQEDKYLELHTLYWLNVQYITISKDGRGDLSKLLRHLKKLGYYGEMIYRDMELFSSNSTMSTRSDNRSSDKSLTSIEKKEIKSVCPRGDDDDGTKNNHVIIKKGKCVIINEVNFTTDPKSERQYDKRDGSEMDRDGLRRTFMGMGFDVDVHDDLSKRQIMSSLNRVSEDFDVAGNDCLVVSILSHGYEGRIVSSDGVEISIEAIEDAMCTWKLRDIVKILIVQACQGNTIGSVAGKLATNALAFDAPSFTDICRFGNFASFMSTMKGFKSIRHKLNGSWFIQAVCEVLSQERSISVSELQTAVTRKVMSQNGCVNDCRAAGQIPVFHSRLKDTIYFPPYDEKLAIFS